MARGYLAVDGGGSSSEFLLVNEAGEELLHFFVGSTSKKSIGVEGAAVNISLGARKLLDYLESDDCVLTEVRGVWGLSGCDSAADQAEYEAMLVRAGRDLAFHQVVNDSLLALRAVTSGPGIVLIAGTGSICVGVNAAGETVRLGSWGYQVSDLGSGTWVGSQLLREALLFDDGCRADDPVFSCVYELAGCQPGELGATVAVMDRAAQWAAFARLVFDCPESALCAEIAGQAAGYLAAYVRSAQQRGFSGPVVLAGGLFRSDGLLARVQSLLDVPVTRLDVSPVLGGITLTCDKIVRA